MTWWPIALPVAVPGIPTWWLGAMWLGTLGLWRWLRLQKHIWDEPRSKT